MPGTAQTKRDSAEPAPPDSCLLPCAMFQWNMEHSRSCASEQGLGAALGHGKETWNAAREDQALLECLSTGHSAVVCTIPLLNENIKEKQEEWVPPAVAEDIWCFLQFTLPPSHLEPLRS